MDLFATPAPVVDDRGFLGYCCSSKPQLSNSLERWNYLYRHYDAEFCELRQRLFVKAHGYSIAEATSVQLCFIERYSACVNFRSPRDNLTRHVCDMLPLVIGSALDLRVRHKFWARGKPAILEDVPKIGFIIQNKNYYNFTACLTTNPKVCHIYRRNTKLQNSEVRAYFYDRNFRGNKLYKKQILVFEKCAACVARGNGAGSNSAAAVSTGADANGPGSSATVPDNDDESIARANCTMQMYVQETLMMRNCYKHDYMFLERRCTHCEKHVGVRETIASIFGHKYTGESRLVCSDVFPLGGSTKVLKYQCGKSLSTFILCDCSSAVLMQEYTAWRERQWSPVLRFENFDKMYELNETCFMDSAAEDRSREGIVDKMFTLFIYMHEVLLRNEDIDLLCNKCIFEGPVLYGQFMQQLNSYLCEKYSTESLFTDVVDTLVSKMRELSHTGNLYMLISRKTNIRVDLTNDMKRLLKSNVRREKMENVDVCTNVKIFSSSASSSGGAPPQALPGGGGGGAGGSGKRSQGPSISLDDVASGAGDDKPGDGGAAQTIDAYGANSNSDFLLRRKHRQKRSVFFDVEKLRAMLEPYGRTSGAGSATSGAGSLALTDGSPALSAGSRALTDGSLALTDGSLALNDGSLAPGAGSLTPGADSLTPGAGSLALTDGSMDVDGSASGSSPAPDSSPDPATGAGVLARNEAGEHDDEEDEEEDEHEDDDALDDDGDQLPPPTKRVRGAARKSAGGRKSRGGGGAGTVVSIAGGSGGGTVAQTFYTGPDPYRENRVLLYSSARDYNSKQLLNYGNLYLLQGIGAAHYTDTEFIMEQVKRPRITNQQNSSKCALIPRGFVRFLSFYNIGSLAKAGRNMSYCARTKLSFFVNPVVHVAERYFQWFVATYADDRFFAYSRPKSIFHCIAHEAYRCARCFLFLVINEVPYCQIFVDRRLEYSMFLMSKLRWPAVQFYRKSHVILSVSIQSGIIMVPMIVNLTPSDVGSGGGAGMEASRFGGTEPSRGATTDGERHRWLWCPNCLYYFPTRPEYTSTLLRLDYALKYTYHRFVESLARDDRVGFSPEAGRGDSAPCQTHAVSVPCQTHAVSVPCQTHAVSASYQTHAVPAPGQTHAVSSPCQTHAVPAPGQTHAVSSPCQTHAVPASGQTHAVSALGQTHAVSAPGQTHAVSAPGQTHAVSTVCQTHAVSTVCQTHAVSAPCQMHSPSPTHAVTVLGQTHASSTARQTPAVSPPCSAQRGFSGGNDSAPTSCGAVALAPTSDRFLDGMLQHCPHHLWFSPNDLRYYELYLKTATHRAALPLPLYYEVVCHGGFETGRNIAHVDISKTIVSINAAKRRLRLGSDFAQPWSKESPFETLVDQNTRIVVYDEGSNWRRAAPPPTKRGDEFMALRNPANEPLHDIVSVPDNNTFFCCFAFGDFEGFNCEDAYVFDVNSRPRVENVVQLKVNYYKFDRSVIKTNMVQFFFRPMVHLNPGNGCTIFLGEIVSYYKLSFGSTMINVKLIRHSSGLFRYRLCYVNNSSYIRRESELFDGYGEDGLRFEPLDVRVNRYSDPDYAKHNSKSNMVVLYDAVAVSCNHNVAISAQMNTRQLRFRVSLKNVRTVQKIQNNCGQKGMPVYRDLGDFVTERGGRVHMIVSIYSVLGRQPLSQFLEQYSNGGCNDRFQPLMKVFSRSTGRQVGWAGYGCFCFSCDAPHENIIVSGPNCGNNPMRACNLTYYAAIDSGLSTGIFNRISDHENYKNNPLNGMPANVYKLLSLYRYFNRSIEFKDFVARRAREQLRDWVNLTSFGIRADLPDYLVEKLSGGGSSKK